MLTITQQIDSITLDLTPLDLYDMTVAELTEVRTLKRDEGGMWFPQDKLGRNLAVALKVVARKLLTGPADLGYGITAEFSA